MEARDIIENALLEKRFKLLEHEALELLKQYSIPIPQFLIARAVDEAVEAAEKIGYPVVLKVISPDIVHKSDVGGVKLNISSAKEAREAAEDILNNVKKRTPNARIYGLLVQKMEPPGVEVIVGGMRDTVFGTVVIFGLGGIFVEILRDIAIRIAPITLEEAEHMINEIKASQILKGYRGSPPVNRKAIANIITKTAKILDENREIMSIDLNPVIAYTDRAVVVDARIMLSSSTQRT